MGTIKFIIIILFITVIFSPRQVFAHFLATDKNIGAVLHIDPNDQPVAGSQALFFFEFKDKENKFRSENCDCTFSIITGGKEIFSQGLFQNTTNPNLSNASVFYTFPKIGVYQVKVVGKPLTPNGFQSFTITWDFRIDQQANGQAGQGGKNSNFLVSHFVHFIAVGIFLIFFIAYFIQKLFFQKNQITIGGEKENEEDSSNVY